MYMKQMKIPNFTKGNIKLQHLLYNFFLMSTINSFKLCYLDDDI